MTQDKQTIVMLGATSHLAQACSRLLAEAGHKLVLVGRNEQKLNVTRDDLMARGAEVDTVVSDLDDIPAHEALVEQLTQADSFWFFAGSLPDQQHCESSWNETNVALVTNGLGTMSLLTRLGNICETRGAGSFVVISSVAGDRGRSSNYVYGAAKGALSVFCDGLRGRLQKANVALLVVKPGFFVSPMTKNVEKKPAVLWVEADRVASDVVKAWSHSKDVIYTPWFWRPIMRIIREIPTPIFKKLSI